MMNINIILKNKCMKATATPTVLQAPSAAQGNHGDSVRPPPTPNIP